MASWSFSTMSGGVPFGAAMPCQMIRFVTGDEFCDGGTPGSASEGAAPETAQRPHLAGSDDSR